MSSEFAQIVLISATLNEPVFVRVRNAISVYALCLAAISIVSYSHSITIGTPDEPYLAKSDGEGYFAEAMLLRDGNILDQLSASRTNYLGYQFILACAFRLFSPDLMIGLLINNSALLLTVILLARTTFILTGDPRPAFFASLAFILTSKFIFYANVLLKDPFLTLGVALLAYAFVKLKMMRGNGIAAYGSILGAVMIFAMRLPMLVLIPGGFLLLGREALKKGWISLLRASLGQAPWQASSQASRRTNFHRIRSHNKLSKIPSLIKNCKQGAAARRRRRCRPGHGGNTELASLETCDYCFRANGYSIRSPVRFLEHEISWTII